MGHLFGVSSRGRYMMLPKDTEPGDAVCILLGCDVPVVLRREGDYWRVIGDCFCLDLMNGEAIDREGLWRNEVQKFKLC